MLKRNKKIVSMVLLATFTAIELPLNTVGAFALETSGHKVTTKESNQNATLALDYFSSVYKEKYKLNGADYNDLGMKETSSLKKITLSILDKEVMLKDGNVSTGRDYIASLIEELEKDTRVLSKFHIGYEILGVQGSNAALNNEIEKTLESSTQSNGEESESSEALEETNITPNVSDAPESPKVPVGSTLELYFYHTSNLKPNEVDIIIRDAYNRLKGKYTTSFNENMLKVKEADSSDFTQGTLDNNILDTIGINDNKEYFNINSKIPGVESIPEKLKIKPIGVINTSSLSSLKGIQAILVEFNGEAHLLNNVDAAKKYLLNTNLSQNSSIKISVLTKDASNNLHNYSLTKNFETSVKDTDYKLDISKYESSIGNSKKVNYKYSVASPSGFEGTNVYTIANIPNKLPVEIKTVGNNDITLQTELNEYVDALSVYYMDNNGYFYNKVFEDFKDLSNKGISYNENLEFNFVGLDTNRTYKLSKINGTTLLGNIIIKDNKASLKSLTDEYFIPNGNNTITVTDGTDEFVLPFNYNIPSLQYKILSDDFANNKITINNKTKEATFTVALSDEFTDIEVKYSNMETPPTIETTKIGTNLVSIKLNNLDTLPEIYTDKLSVVVNGKATYIPIYKDATLPTINIIKDNVFENNGVYHFNKSSLQFEIKDNDQVKKISIQKNNETPVELICNVRSSSDYSYLDNKLTVNNIPKDVKTTYKIIIEDINGNESKAQAFEVINDSKTPVIKYAQSPTSQYGYGESDGNKNIYIMADKVVNNSFNFYFSISEDMNVDPSIIDGKTLSLSYNNKVYYFNENEIQFDKDKGLYFVPLQLPSQDRDMEIAINVKDFANNNASEYKLGVVYSNDVIVDENIKFGLEGIEATNLDVLKSTSIMNEGNFDLYVSKDLKGNKLRLDANNGILNSFNSLNSVSFKLNDNSPVTFYKNGNKFDIPEQSFILNKGDNTIEFELACTNGRKYKGKINVYYDPSPLSIQLVDTDGNDVINKNYTDITENSYTGLKKPVKEIRITDGNKKEISSLSIEFMGKNLTVNDFKVDSDNPNSLVYKVENFEQGMYSLNYAITSIFDNDSNPNNGFNSKDRSIKTDAPLKYKYDVSKPEISSDVLTPKYMNTKIFNNRDSISIGSVGSDVMVSDNLNDVLDIEYKISDREGNLYVQEILENVKSYNVPLLGATGSSLPNGQYVIQIKITDSVGNTSGSDGEYFTRVFIVDDTKPVINMTHDGLLDGDRLNSNFNASIFVSDFDLDFVTISVEKYASLSDDNPETVYSKTFDDEATKEGAEFTTTIDNKIEEIKNLSSGIYRVRVVSNDRSSNGNGEVSEVSNFIFYDNLAPEINLGMFTDSYTNSKIYNSSNNKITIGNDSKSDIVVTDNMSDDLQIEYFIYDEEGINLLKVGDYQGGIGLNGLGDGRYKIVVQVTDDTDNTSVSNFGNFVIDSTAPSYKIDGLSYNNGDLELFNRPVKPSVELHDISISTINVKVVLPNGEVVVKSSGVTSDKNFVASFDEFSENGDYTLYIDATDRAGNVLNTVVRRFRIDTTAPTIGGVLVNGNRINPDIMNYTNTHNSSIFVNFTDNLDVIGDMDLVLTATKNGSVRNLKNGDSLKEDGEYTINAQVKDKAGNLSTVYTFKLTVDTVLPVINVAGVNTGHYYNKDVTPSWKVDDETASLSVTLNGNPFDSSVLSNEGNYTLTLKATDLAGNVATNVVTFVIDKTAPKITVDNLENLGYYTEAITPTIKWDDPDGVATMLLQNINYYGQEINKDGSYVLYVKVVDKAGNISDASYKFRLNVSKPEITVVGVSDGDTITGGFLPDFKFKDTVEYQILLNGKAYHGEEITEDGSYTFVITAKDEDGVETVKSVSFNVENASKETISTNGNNDKKDSSNLPLAVGSGVGLLVISAIGYLLFRKNK